MLLSALFNMEEVKWPESISPTQWQRLWSAVLPTLNQTKSWLKSMPWRHKYYLFQQEQEETVHFQREAKPVRGEPTPRLLPTSPVLPLPSCPHTPAASHAGVPTDRTRTTAILLQEGGTISSYPHVVFAVTLTRRPRWGPLPCSAAACPALGKRTSSAREQCQQLRSCDTPFCPSKIMSCDGYITKTWILPTEESRTSASVEKLGLLLFC